MVSAAPTSGQTSARPSVDRQVQSQNNQPQTSLQQVTAPLAPSVSLPTPPPSQQQLTVAPTKPTSKDERCFTARSSRSSPAPNLDTQQGRLVSGQAPSCSSPVRSNTLTPSVIPQKRPLDVQETIGIADDDRLADSLHAPDLSVRLSVSEEPNLVYSDFTSPEIPASSRHDQVSTSAGTSVRTSSRGSQIPQEDAQAPAIKRRRVVTFPQTGDGTPSSTSEAISNVPIPTIEISETVVESEGSINSEYAPPQIVEPVQPLRTTHINEGQQSDSAGTESVIATAASPSAKPRRPRKGASHHEAPISARKNSGLSVDPTVAANDQNHQVAGHAKPKKKHTKRRSKQSLQDAAAEVVEEAVQGPKENPKKRGRRSRRELTPEGADTQVISPSKVKMSDLCKDNRIGRKSEREKDLAEFERAEYVRKKQRQLREVMDQAEPENQIDSSESAEARLERLGQDKEREESIANNVPNTVIVNGQIQIDEESLQIDRHAMAARERDHEALEAIDETDLNRKVNSASWLRRDKSGGWNESLTERFYEGLRMFGTDFQMISKMFPGRTRHKIKLKFVKEEKLNEDKIKATLLGEKISVNLPELEKLAGVEFDDPRELERDIEEDRKRLEEETLAEKQALDDARHEREKEIAAERDAAGEESSAKENRRGKARKKKGEKQRAKKGSSKRNERNPQRGQLEGEAAVFGNAHELQET